MPPVLGAVAAAALAGGVGVALGAVTLTAALGAVATTAITAGLQYAMRPREGTPAAVAAQPAPANGERTLIVAQPSPSRRIVYGRCKTGGALFFQDNDNPFLYTGTLISDGRIEAVDGVFFGDSSVQVDALGNAVQSSPYYTKFYIDASGLGSATQTASTMLTGVFAELTSAYKQSGIARVVAKMHWGDDAQQHSVLWGSSTAPTYLVRGVRVYDPRDVSQSVTDNTTWKYSDNPALCVAHALMHVWDSPLLHTEVDWPSVVTAANACDFQVIYASETRKRYILGGVLEANTDIASQVSAMLASMGGAITFDNGKYSIHADASRPSVWTIGDDDIVAIKDVTLDVATEDLFGMISAEYYNGEDAGRKATTPIYTADGTGRATTLGLLFCAAPHSAQIVAYRSLHRSFAKRQMTLTVSEAGLWLLPHVDNVTIVSPSMPLLNGDYEVLQVDLIADGAAIRLREYVPAVDADPETYLV